VCCTPHGHQVSVLVIPELLLPPLPPPLLLPQLLLLPAPPGTAAGLPGRPEGSSGEEAMRIPKSMRCICSVCTWQAVQLFGLLQMCNAMWAACFLRKQTSCRTLPEKELRMRGVTNSHPVTWNTGTSKVTYSDPPGMPQGQWPPCASPPPQG
jgi:hypothetical protein